MLDNVNTIEGPHLLTAHVVVVQLMRMTEDGPLQPTPLWQRGDLEGPALMREFLRESRIVRKGLDGSLTKVSMPRRQLLD